MITGLLEIFCYTLLLLIFAISLGSILFTVKSILTGNYLNRYFSISHKGIGLYELHFSPMLGFYYAKPAKFFKMHQRAIDKFKAEYPCSTLFAETSTLHDFHQRNGLSATPIDKSLMEWLTANGMSYYLVACNLANYRKRNSMEWQIAHLFRRIHQTIPFQYVLVEDKCTS